MRNLFIRTVKCDFKKVFEHFVKVLLDLLWFVCKIQHDSLPWRSDVQNFVLVFQLICCKFIPSILKENSFLNVADFNVDTKIGIEIIHINLLCQTTDEPSR